MALQLGYCYQERGIRSRYYWRQGSFFWQKVQYSRFCWCLNTIKGKHIKVDSSFIWRTDLYYFSWIWKGWEMGGCHDARSNIYLAYWLNCSLLWRSFSCQGCRFGQIGIQREISKAPTYCQVESEWGGAFGVYGEWWVSQVSWGQEGRWVCCNSLLQSFDVRVEDGVGRGHSGGSIDFKSQGQGDMSKYSWRSGGRRTHLFCQCFWRPHGYFLSNIVRLWHCYGK